MLSGLKLNESKTNVLWLGLWKQHTERPLNFVWRKEPLKVLGIHISYEKAGNERKNVNQKIENLGKAGHLEIAPTFHLRALSFVFVRKLNFMLKVEGFA